MQGLAEIAPEVEHPMLGMSAMTILESLGDLDEEGEPEEQEECDDYEE